MQLTAIDWTNLRQRLTAALDHEIDDTAWEALRSLPGEALDAELPWRIEALRPQVPEQGTIYLRPIRQLSAPISAIHCSLCGDPLPAPGRFRCDFCAMAAQLVLEQPVQIIGALVSTVTTGGAPAGENSAGPSWIE